MGQIVRRLSTGLTVIGVLLSGCAELAPFQMVAPEPVQAPFQMMEPARPVVLPAQPVLPVAPAPAPAPVQAQEQGEVFLSSKVVMANKAQTLSITEESWRNAAGRKIYRYKGTNTAAAPRCMWVRLSGQSPRYWQMSERNYRQPVPANSTVELFMLEPDTAFDIQADMWTDVSVQGQCLPPKN